MMTARMKLVTAMALLSVLTACDYVQTKELKEERADRTYVEAMRDFNAGRFGAAKKGFEKALSANPGNSSARFQLALVQQQNRDYLNAVCNYLEYLRLAPDSDKAKYAKERLAICRRDLGVALAKELNLTDNAGVVRESQELRDGLRKAQGELAQVTKDLEEAKSRCRVLEGENIRLRHMVVAVGEEEKTSRISLDEARALLDDDETDRLRVTDEAKSLAADLDADDAPSRISAGAASVPVDDSPSAVLGPRTASQAGATARLTDRVKATRADADQVVAPRPARPKSYVVEPGDTLRKLALRFYGNKGEWQRIREANKSVVPMSGVIRVGQELVIP